MHSGSSPSYFPSVHLARWPLLLPRLGTLERPGRSTKCKSQGPPSQYLLNWSLWPRQLSARFIAPARPRSSWVWARRDTHEVSVWPSPRLSSYFSGVKFPNVRGTPESQSLEDLGRGDLSKKACRGVGDPAAPPGVEVGCAALEPTPTRLTARRRTGPRSPPGGRGRRFRVGFSRSRAAPRCEGRGCRSRCSAFDLGMPLESPKLPGSEPISLDRTFEQ